METEMSVLVGKKIKEVFVNDDELTFTDEHYKQYIFDAYGDCCSYTWWDGIDDAQNLIGGTVISAENIEMPERFSRVRPGAGDVIAYYGVKITTDKGIAIVDFRNDSNGYYGGWYSYRKDVKRDQYGDEVKA